MSNIILRSESVAERTAYHAVRRAQASIATYRHFNDNDLAQYLGRDAFATIAGRLADKFFHKSQGLAIHALAVEIYQVLLIMAPILQRLPLSCKLDWHRGHLISWFRVNCCNKRRRFHCRVREVERIFQPDLLMVNLARLGIHDAAIVEAIFGLYRRHCGGRTVKDCLAHQLFDPIMLLNAKEGYELRHGNRLFRLEQDTFAGAVDMREQPFTVLDFSLMSKPHKGGRHLEITIADDTLRDFRSSVKAILTTPAAPEFKLQRIELRIRDLVERTRPARSALPQILELKRWLAHKIAPLSGTAPEAKVLPNLLANLWLQRSDSRLHLIRPNFFFDASHHDEKTYATFFSPYREV